MKHQDLQLLSRSPSFQASLHLGQASSSSDLDFQLLGQGEYNINYLFTHPHTQQKLVLRLTTASQMHLHNQIRYEYDALMLLTATGRTPRPLYVDDTKTIIPYGFLVMQYLPGHALSYQTDLEAAAHCLADIHNLDIDAPGSLIAPRHPLHAILEECHQMAQVYFDCALGNPETKQMIQHLLEYGDTLVSADIDCGRRCIVNTELNAGNFLINPSGEPSYLIDWEKPLYAFLQQDLGHFLAPTTTYWKTDTILKIEEIMAFLQHYCRHSTQTISPEQLWNTTLPYFTMTCLRGITWCAMAWVQYQSPDKLIRNEDTYQKITEYLSDAFLQRILTEYLEANV